jgi:hypothetical protein
MSGPRDGRSTPGTAVTAEVLSPYGNLGGDPGLQRAGQVRHRVGLRFQPRRGGGAASRFSPARNVLSFRPPSVATATWPCADSAARLGGDPSGPEGWLLQADGFEHRTHQKNGQDPAAARGGRRRADQAQGPRRGRLTSQIPPRTGLRGSHEGFCCGRTKRGGWDCVSPHGERGPERSGGREGLRRNPRSACARRWSRGPTPPPAGARPDVV